MINWEKLLSLLPTFPCPIVFLCVMGVGAVYPWYSKEIWAELWTVSSIDCPGDFLCVRVFGVVSFWCWVMLYNLLFYRNNCVYNCHSINIGQHFWLYLPIFLTWRFFLWYWCWCCLPTVSWIFLLLISTTCSQCRTFLIIKIGHTLSIIIRSVAIIMTSCIKVQSYYGGQKWIIYLWEVLNKILHCSQYARLC